MDNCAILIPCYNEEKTIQKVIMDWRREIPEAKIYVYDNNSTDRTAEIAQMEGAIVRREYKQGKGNVIRRMFREIDAYCYIMVDGDDTYPAEYGHRMMQEILEKKADMVVGDRLSSTYFEENKRPFHNFGNSLVRRTINILFKTDIKDIMTGYRAFNYNFVKTFPILSKGFEIETEMTIHAVDKNMQVENIVIDYRDRPEGSVSKLDTVSDGIKVIKTIEKMFRNYKPQLYFGILSGMFEVVALMLFLPILFEFLVSGMVPRVPTLIVAGFVALLGIQSFFSGLILSSLVEKDKRDFELTLIDVQQKLEFMKEKY